MPKISLFFVSLAFGGVERIIVVLAQELVRRGYTVDIVLGIKEGEFLADLDPAITVYDLQTPPPRTMSRLPGLVRYLREQRPTTLLSFTDGSNLVATWARRVAGVPIRLVLDTQVSWYTHAATSAQMSRYHALKYRVLMPALLHLTYRQADAIVACSHGVASDTARVSGVPLERITVIYNPVFTPDLHAKAEAAVEHPWFAPDAPPLILGVGRLAEQKDFFTLLRAFALVRQRRLARLLIVGEGPDRPALEVLAQTLGIHDDVALPGFATNPYAYMRQASLFVLSSRFEGLPAVLIEALAVGVPIVSTNCPHGPDEILEGGTYGSLVPVGDAAAMAEAMCAMLDAPLPREMLQQRSAIFSLDASVRKYIQVLDPL
jgi:glycosyltransferase involved in cell wall biosynthesis